MMSSKDPTLVDVDIVEKKGSTVIPSYIGSYKVESVLGKGSTSVLYLGVHPKTHEPIAIKVLPQEYLGSKEVVARFMRESEIIALTTHPNIVRLFGQGRWEGGLYIAMEFIQGLTLRQMILQQTMPLKRALEIVMQIAHALAHLHAHGVIHRDLKPENILLTTQGGVKVIDFGIAALNLDANEVASPKKRVLGTPAYMSPEQRDNPASVSYNTDIYSLAVICYELVLGRLSHGVIHLALMPKGLQKILSKSLQSDPKSRYEDIIDFISDLSEYLSSEEIKKEMRGSDYLGELNENLKTAKALLVPETIPSWPHFEMALASNSSQALSSIYYDFFQRGTTYHVVLAESIVTGVEGLLHIAMLRGMLKALNHLVDTPKTLLTHLNQLILEDNKEQSYSLSYLTIVPSENRFSYISCGYSPLWHLPSGTSVPRRLMADNIALGLSPEMAILEIDSNFTMGDSLLLHTFQAGLSKSIKDIEGDEKNFLEALTDSRYLPPKPQVDAILRKITHLELQERPITVISLSRVR